VLDIDRVRALRAIPGVVLYDDGQGETGTVPCNVQGLDADDVVRRLGEQRIVVCAAYENNALLGLRKLNVDSLVRISAHYFNTDDEVATLVAALERISAPRLFLS